MMNKTPWKKIPKTIRRNIHGSCSYLAMFPPNIPNYFIKQYTKEGDLVFDPFSGRGTTITEAVYLNRNAIGSDLNPLAIILSRSKVNVPSKNTIIKRLNYLEKEFQKNRKIDISKVDKDIKMIFSYKTLKELVFLQSRLDWKKGKVDTYITAMILGIIHGGSKNYLSIQMPNTFSMAPNYTKKYIRENSLKKEYRNCFKCLHHKLENCYEAPKQKGRVLKQDAIKMHKIKNKKTDLIITSPPYLNVIKYGQYNWIRLWFIKEDARMIDADLFTSQSLHKYTEFMKEFLKQSKRILKRSGKIVLVIGDVGEVNLAKQVWLRSAKPLGFTKKHLLSDTIEDSSKTTRIWNERKGQATKVDRILVLSN